MSSKINVIEIIAGHFDTLRDSNNKRSNVDLFTFVGFPIALGIISSLLCLELKFDITSLFVNFGSVLTALLLSVLMLIYEQETRLNSVKPQRRDKEQESDWNLRLEIFNLKKLLLNHLYYNISFSVICSLFLVILCFVYSFSLSYEWQFSFKDWEINIIPKIIIAPLIIILLTNLLLSILMIVKRMHILLTTNEDH